MFSFCLRLPGGGRTLENQPTVERWRFVVVVLATIAALPLFLFENPNSTGSLTGMAGPGTTAEPTLHEQLVEEGCIEAPTRTHVRKQ